MPVLNPSSRPKVYLYFSPKNGANAKAFAFAVKNDPNNKVEVIMIWSTRFEGAYLDASAIVVERGCPREEQIVNTYRAHRPDCEIHYMHPSGDWEDPDSDSSHSGEQQETPRRAAKDAQAASESELPEDEDGSSESPY